LFRLTEKKKSKTSDTQDCSLKKSPGTGLDKKGLNWYLLKVEVSICPITAGFPINRYEDFIYISRS
jgi:hypothetical protein